MESALLHNLLLILILLTDESLALQPGIWTARANLHGDSNTLRMGTLIFRQIDVLGSPVRVTGRLMNLRPNTRYHGFHVHMYALPDGEWGCSRAGEHWNPFRKIHGGRNDPIERRHVGDLGNIWSDQFGTAMIDFEDSIIQLHPMSISSIVNRAIVVHQDMDDFGRGMYSDSQTTGHSGLRIACGNIQLFNERSTLPSMSRPFRARHCDCMSTTGQCVSHGNYQCSSQRESSIVQCIGNNRWATIERCQSSCVFRPNNRPYCN